MYRWFLLLSNMFNCSYSSIWLIFFLRSWIYKQIVWFWKYSWSWITNWGEGVMMNQKKFQFKISVWSLKPKRKKEVLINKVSLHILSGAGVGSREIVYRRGPGCKPKSPWVKLVPVTWELVWCEEAKRTFLRGNNFL